MKPKPRPNLSLLTVQTWQRDATEENAGRLAVHIEYVLRHDPYFKTWYMCGYMVERIARRPAGTRQYFLQENLEVLVTAIRRRTRQRRKS
jgi:hypothetical protein